MIFIGNILWNIIATGNMNSCNTFQKNLYKYKLLNLILRKNNF